MFVYLRQRSTYNFFTFSSLVLPSPSISSPETKGIIMSLNTVSTGNTILAADVNQLVNVLQRPSGQTETGKYYMAGFATTSSQTLNCYIPSQSRTSTPVSVTIDTADLSPTGINTPTTAHLTSSGFNVGATSTGSGSNIGAGGNYTIQY